MLIAREHGQVAASGTDERVAACVLPQVDGFKVPVGCRLTAEEDCSWTVDCGSKTNAISTPTNANGWDRGVVAEMKVPKAGS